MEKKKSLSDVVTCRLQEDIQSGKYAVGDKLPTEKELMDLYKVGRSTIREAVKLLSMSRMLTVRQGSGTYVNKRQILNPPDILNKAKFDEINDARRLLEADLVLRACRSATDEQLKAIEASIQEKKDAILLESKEACIKSDILFHLRIAEAANHKVLFWVYQSFTDMITDFFRLREPHGISCFAMSYYLHEKLYLAIKSKKEKQAIKILHNILNNNFSL
ncbi:GntR family transcriptional regulator [Elizabethkingia argentiflava]|uniref:GntR family transcriptional regulator n=1 Tax=Elizabethkingia argenteiflava TaxID=2681556 RepID=A0A845PY39_9FLAO|nr:GntR family transcriptional regulator [Elizabethkingia argenteiflava]NAW51841.1 GntR family transcriptional regulator [Elizabethkingia argenteiflava]